MPSTTFVFLAGIGNSGPEHWQYMWHQRVGGVWVEHDSWDEPSRDAWVKDLDEALRGVDGPKILVAHSLGCLLVTEWAAEHADPAIEGAFLVFVEVRRESGFYPQPFRFYFGVIVMPLTFAAWLGFLIGDLVHRYRWQLLAGSLSLGVAMVVAYTLVDRLTVVPG